MISFRDNAQQWPVNCPECHFRLASTSRLRSLGGPPQPWAGACLEGGGGPGEAPKSAGSVSLTEKKAGKISSCGSIPTDASYNKTLGRSHHYSSIFKEC